MVVVAGIADELACLGTGSAILWFVFTSVGLTFHFLKTRTADPLPARGSS
jgi:hypothetical protein